MPNFSSVFCAGFIAARYLEGSSLESHRDPSVPSSFAKGGMATIALAASAAGRPASGGARAARSAATRAGGSVEVWLRCVALASAEQSDLRDCCLGI